VHFLAFGFGSGKAPVAPGTFGTLVGIPAYLLLQPLATYIYVAVITGLFGVGVWLCHITEQDLGVHDHSGIVWDEIVGYLITMFMAPVGWMWIALGFVLFRLFDIWKPFPIRQIEHRVHGGFGNMLDDALAAVYAWLVLQAVAYLVTVGTLQLF
jgi:phosphatidylglycerophosphatase A